MRRLRNRLSVSDVQTIIAQAVAEAKAQGKPAVIAVVDRVGNVLAVYSMAGAPPTATIRSAPDPANNTDLRRADRTGCGRGHRQGDHRRLSVVRRQCLLHPHRQRDRAAEFSARAVFGRA